jgi:glutaredoxin-like YruB-family protein
MKKVKIFCIPLLLLVMFVGLALAAPKVELYTTSWCPYCQKARDFFRSRGIAFTEYDVEKDKEAALRKKKLDNRNGVPFVVIDGRTVHGYSDAAYEAALRGGK